MPHTNKRTRALDYQESTGYINLQNANAISGAASDPVKNTSLKNQIRSVQRLLRRKGLTEDRKAALMKRFQLLENLKDARASKAQERTLALKYHKVKFFERRRAERRLAKIRTQMAMVDSLNPPSGELLMKLKTAEEDLLYVTYFPKTAKYISLYGKRSGDGGSAYTEATRKRQLHCREQALQAAANAADAGEALPTDVAAESSKKLDDRDSNASQLRTIPQYPLEADDESSSLCGAEDSINIIDPNNNDCLGHDENPTTAQQEVLEVNSSDDEDDESCSSSSSYPPNVKEDNESSGQEDGNTIAARVTEERDSKSSSSIQTRSLEGDDDESVRKSDDFAKRRKLEHPEGNTAKRERLNDGDSGTSKTSSTITQQFEHNNNKEEELPSYAALDDFFVEEERDCDVVNEKVEEISRKNSKQQQQQWGKKSKHDDSLGKHSGRKGYHRAAYFGRGGRGANKKGKTWQSFRKKNS